MKMSKKVAKISLLMTVVTLSVILPIFAVTAKKPEWKINPVHIDEMKFGMTWADWADEPWLKGSGTEEDPYMIKNVVIDAGGNFFCMLIMNSKAYFKIMDCTFSNSGPINSTDGRNAALILGNTQNGVIFKNKIFDAGTPGSGQGSGIALIASINNKIQKNLCYDNEGPGIYLQYSNDNIIRQNLCERNQWGIMISEWSNNNEITKNECYDNLDYGIHLWGESNGNLVTKNRCSNNGGSGIILEGCNGNLIAENHCSGNLRPNIYLRYSNDNLITENLCTGSPWGIVIRWSYNNDVVNNECVENGEGIVLQEDSADNRITNNTCANNYDNGIILIFNANYNVISQNDFLGNGLSGISVHYSEGNSIDGNNCSDNGEQGILIKEYSNYNIITDNDCRRNLDSGILVDESNGNVVLDNICSENIWVGIALVSWAEDNVICGNELLYNWAGVYFSYVRNNDIFRNNIKHNTHGIFMHRDCESNLIYHNNIVDNDMQVFDLSPGLNNWHNVYMLEGNYWSDYDGEDNNGDGIGDTPWPGPGYDNYPFLAENGWDVTTLEEDEYINAYFDPTTNRLIGYATVRDDETCYIIIGWKETFEERTQRLAFPPYTMSYQFDSTIYSFDGNFWVWDETIFGLPGYFQLFYKKVSPNYFTVDLDLELGTNNFAWIIGYHDDYGFHEIIVNRFFDLV